MTDNSRQIIERMQASFPHLYNVYDKSTILYALLSVFGERMGTRTDIIDRLYAMIGIDSTYDEDLEHRWGSLLGVYRQNGESFNDYRSRLLIVYSSLAGGTAEAIKFAIASAIGITSDTNAINQYIKVYDAWKYPYEVPDKSLTNKDDVLTNQNFITNTEVISATYGHIICTVDLSVNEGIAGMYSKIMNAINTTKASGIYPYLLFIYITHELTTLSYREQIFDKISEKSSELSYFVSAKDTYYPQTNNGYLTNSTFMTNREIHVDNVDDYYDNIIQKIVEGCSITRIKSTEWERDIGTTNDTMITNQFADTDEIYDKVISSNIDVVSIDSDDYTGTELSYLSNEESGLYLFGSKQSDDSSLFGSAIFGQAVFGRYLDGADKFVDVIKHTIQESRAVHSDVNTEIWSRVGTNNAVLNDGFVTNMLMETDEFSDEITYT